MYQTVYDIRESIPWDSFLFVSVGLLIMAVGGWMWLVAHDKVPQGLAKVLEQLPRRRPPSKQSLRTSSFVVMAFGVLWIFFAGTGIIGGWLTYRAALDAGEHELAEGIVEDFQPLARHADTPESFTVNGVYFSYSDYNISPAFKTSQSKGGPIREGLAVRISYLPHAQKNAILKVEIPANEPATAPSDESIQAPMLPFGLVWSLLMALGVAVIGLLFFNRNPILKRRLFPALVTAATLLLVFYGLDSSSSPAAIALIVPLMLFNLWVIRFCDACGATVLPQGSWKRPTWCHNCGHKLGG